MQKINPALGIGHIDICVVNIRTSSYE
jgi:hypothetical protein